MESTTVLGVDVAYQVDGRGKFSARLDADDDPRFDGIELEGFAALEELRKATRKAIEKARRSLGAIDVPVTFMNASDGDGGYRRRDLYGEQPRPGTLGLVHCTFRGVNAAHGATLLTLADGSKATDDGRSGAVLARRLTEAEIAEYDALAGAVKASIAALEAFTNAHHVRPEELAAAAVKLAAEKAEAAS